MLPREQKQRSPRNPESLESPCFAAGSLAIKEKIIVNPWLSDWIHLILPKQTIDHTRRTFLLAESDLICRHGVLLCRLGQPLSLSHCKAWSGRVGLGNSCYTVLEAERPRLPPGEKISFPVVMASHYWLFMCLLFNRSSLCQRKTGEMKKNCIFQNSCIQQWQRSTRLKYLARPL